MHTISKVYHDAFNEIQDNVDTAILKECQEVLIRYLAKELDDIPINNLNKVPVKGKVRFVDEGEFYNDYTPFESEVYDSPTWLEIAVIANKMLEVTKDKDRIFLETLEVNDDGNGIKIATIIMGN